MKLNLNKMENKIKIINKELNKKNRNSKNNFRVRMGNKKTSLQMILTRNKE